jgi:uncharacterized Ntn-hydrolase superfamily protein
MIPRMRTTIQLDDELFDQLRAQARKEKVSLTRLLNRALKAGLQAGSARPREQSAYCEQVHSMGVPRPTLDKAHSLAARLEDEGIVRRLEAQE